MSFLQLPNEIKVFKGQEVEIKLTGEFPALFYAKIVVENNIFGISSDIVAIENGIVYKGVTTSAGIVKVDFEQVWGAEMDPTDDYICIITIEEPEIEYVIDSNIDEIPAEIKDVVIEIIKTENIQQPESIPYQFEGFLTKSLKKNVGPEDSFVSIIVQSQIAQLLKITTSYGNLSESTLDFRNINEPSSIFFTFPERLSKGLIYGLKLTYLDKIINIMLPAGVVLRDNKWKDDLMTQLLLLEEIDQLEWSWKWDEGKLHAAASPYYQGYKVEWLTSPDITLSYSFFSAPYSDDTQIVKLYLDKDQYWVDKTIQLEIESIYKAKNSKIEIKLYNTVDDLYLTPHTTFLPGKGIKRINLELNTPLSTDFNGIVNISSGSLKKWSNVRLIKDKINIPAGSTSDYIEIQTLVKTPGYFDLVFSSKHRNMLPQEWRFEIPEKSVEANKKDVEFIFTSSYKSDTIFISMKPKERISDPDDIDVMVNGERVSVSVSGEKNILIKYRKIVSGLYSLPITIKDKQYTVLVYDEIMPNKLINIGGKWKLTKAAPIDIIMEDNVGKTYIINEGQSWIPEVENVSKVIFKTTSGQFLFEQEIGMVINPPVMQLKIKNNIVIVETNYLPSQPVRFVLRWNSEVINGVLNPGDKRWYSTLNQGQHSFKLTSSDVTVINDRIDIWIS